ncbi:MAG TPA: hypothetical protein VF175_16005 [Lacipirellula sp.]
MSDELRLPDELAACEARLAAMRLPATAIDRDELMYRAGWAAGAETARLAVGNSPPLKVEEGPRRRGARGGIRLFAASLTSAAVAASLAVVITLQSRPNDPEQVAVAPQPSDAATTVVAETPRPSTVAAATVEPPSRGRRRLPTIDVGLLALRRDALFRDGSLSVSMASSQGDPPAAAAKTARELLDELLPADPVQYTPSWPWRKNLAGDSI